MNQHKFELNGDWVEPNRKGQRHYYSTCRWCHITDSPFRNVGVCKEWRVYLY